MCVKYTLREGINHFSDMKNSEFISFLLEIGDKNNGILKDIRCVSKLDGLGARFGKDTNHRIFIESSRSGPIFNVGDFFLYTIKRTDSIKVINRSTHYDDMLELIQQQEFMNNIPADCKIVCEFFYTPMAEINNNGYKFVNITYDKDKIGEILTISPYNVLIASTGEQHPNKDYILKCLYEKSNKDIMITSPELYLTEINISSFINQLKRLLYGKETILNSRKHKDKNDKIRLLESIQHIKIELSEYILNHPNIDGKFKFGDSIEGIVLYIPNLTNKIIPYKIVTKEFKELQRNKDDSIKNNPKG